MKTALRLVSDCRSGPRLAFFSRAFVPVVVLGLTILSAPAWGETEAKSEVEKLRGLSIEDLLQQDVTTVSRTPEKLSQSPSAIQVLTGEDIRRSGAMNLPEALRLAPNLQVGQVNAHDWAITARGFNGAPLANNNLADKLLVMIDGRSIYTPLFGGVYWDVQNVLLEDVDRIEVVSGPGGSLWGANAVNGVINVVSKSARDTQGAYVTGGAGSFWEDHFGARYGDQVSSNLFVRVYAQRFDHGSTETPSGIDLKNSWDMTQGGFRADWYPNQMDQVTLQGDLYAGREDSPTSHSSLNGQNVLGRWTRKLSDESDFSLQMYFDRTLRDFNTPTFFEDELTTYDLDFQHRFPIGERHSLLWGVGYRLMDNHIENSPGNLMFSPPGREMQLFNGFIQDEVTLIEDRLKLTLGTKLEHNEFSGYEVQPSGRLAWTPSDRHTVWMAVSRAVHSPSRFDTDVTFPIVGDRDFDSEELIAYEAGYRVRPLDRLSLSVAAFYNDYDELRSLNFVSVAPFQFAFVNGQSAETWGLELAATLQVTDWWRIRGGYTYLDTDFHPHNIGLSKGSDTFEAVDPHHQVVLQSTMDLPANFQLDVIGRYVDVLPTSALQITPLNTALTFAPSTPSYFEMDIRVAWRYKNWELAVVGQNLLDDSHPEFGIQEIPRGVFARLTWRF